MPTIKKFNLFIIWAHRVPDAFEEVARPGSKLKFLREPYWFRPFFESARNDPVPIEDASFTLELQAPWPKRGHGDRPRFWRSYLEGYSLDALSGKQAWKSLVPLRAKLPFPVRCSEPNCEVRFEVFFYPYGLVLAANIEISQDLSLRDAVVKLFKIRYESDFITVGKQGQTSSARLNITADKALKKLRDYAWGTDTPYVQTDLDPFTIFTVIQGSDVDPAGTISAGSDIHRALEAVTSWHLTWQTDPLPPLEDVLISSHKPRIAAVSEFIYARKRGRAIWSPSKFTAVATGPHLSPIKSLSCYNRNLDLAAVQVESLAGYVRQIVGKITGNAQLKVTEEECARNAAGALGRLYGGVSSYRSWSVRIHIEQNGWVNDINLLRAKFGMPPLK